jgi:hypothetical protein
LALSNVVLFRGRLRRREAMDGASGAEAERSGAQDVRRKRPEK